MLRADADALLTGGGGAPLVQQLLQSLLSPGDSDSVASADAAAAAAATAGPAAATAAAFRDVPFKVTVTECHACECYTH